MRVTINRFWNFNVLVYFKFLFAVLAKVLRWLVCFHILGDLLDEHLQIKGIQGFARDLCDFNSLLLDTTKGLVDSREQIKNRYLFSPRYRSRKYLQTLAD